MIQLYKGKIRKICDRLQFGKVTRVVIYDIMEDAITWMNNITPKFGIREHLIPKMIITEKTLE